MKLKVLTIFTILVLCCTCSEKEKVKQEEKLPDAPTAFTSKHEKVKIVFFSTRGENDMFWGLFRDFMHEAVKDLDMELKVYYAEGNHLTMIKQVQDSINNDRPDVILFPNFKKQAPFIIKMANKARVPVFVVNSGVQADAGMGGPREKYKYWIGEMLPDDDGAGYMLARKLASKAKKASNGKIHFLALEGNVADSASIERVKGLKRALKGADNIDLKQIAPANWSPKLATEKFLLFQKSRYKNLTVVWTASDGMALGVVKGIKELGLKPGKDIVTGGVDWAQDGINAVRKGEVTATVGGHYMEGAWSAVLIYDLFHGKDFASESLRMRSRMYVLDKSNVNRYLRKFSRKNWNKINFKRFSKKLNPGITKYNFSVSF